MNKNVRLLTEMAVTVALATVLNFIPLWKMPQGGSVSLEMLPILLIALRRGVGPGMLTGLAYGLIQLAFGAYIVHPLQLILDYPLPYMLLGLAGIFQNKIQQYESKKLFFNILAAVFVGGVARFISHLISGAVFFGQYAPEGQNAWIYSAVYNASYMIPSLIVCYIVLVILTPKLIKQD